MKISKYVYINKNIDIKKSILKKNLKKNYIYII